MFDGLHAPCCPYCGGEMRLEDNEDVLFGLFADKEKMYWYHCDTPSCDTYSPIAAYGGGSLQSRHEARAEPGAAIHGACSQRRQARVAGR